MFPSCASRASLAAVLCALLAPARAQDPGYTSSCQYTTRGSTFDLSPLTVPAGSSYQSVDVRDPTKTYYYNFCSA
jgi:hypothetical protein